MTTAQRDLFNEKLSGLTTLMNAHFANVHAALDAIKEQTTKTNGRVTTVEKQVEKVERDLLTHPINCNQGQEIKTIQKDLEEYRMLKKYPKVAIILITIFVIGTIIALIKTQDMVITKIDETKTEINHRIDHQEGVSKVTRGGYVKYNDQGLSDSIKLR